MPAISDNLIHFLGRQHIGDPLKQLEIFKSIIRQGLRCSDYVVKFGGRGAVTNGVVCFTDIPLSECDEHVAVYGKFGIGFKKSFVKNKGGNPVRYHIDYMPVMRGGTLESRGLLYSILCRHFDIVLRLKNRLDNDAKNGTSFLIHDQTGMEIFSNAQVKDLVSEQIQLLSFEKETGDLGLARDDTKEMDTYYKEREWRLAPFKASEDSGTVIKCEDGYYYGFKRNDVNVVVTPNNAIRVEVLNFLLSLKDADERLKAFADDPPPIIAYDDLHQW